MCIRDRSSDGNGVGRFEGQAVFVPFAAVGDVLSVKVVKICKSYAFGIVESVLTPGTCLLYTSRCV